MQSAETTDFQPSLFRVAAGLRVAWTLTWIVLFIDAGWLLYGGWSVDWGGAALIAIAVAITSALLGISRYRQDLRIRTTLQATELLIVFMAAASTLSYLVVSTNAPLVDTPLAAWDRALGFDWFALHAWLQARPLIQSTLRAAYYSGLFQLTFVVLFLGFRARPGPLAQFMRLFIIATLLTIVVSGAFPAAGTWKHYGLNGAFDLSSLSHFEALRDGHLRHIALGEMQGLIAMPSLHAAMAVLIAYAMRGAGLVLPLFVVLNAAMLIATPVDGGHYLVDVLAGVALAVGLITLDRQRSASPLAVANARPLPAQEAVRR